MSLPRAIAQTLVDHGFAPEVRARVGELYRFLGPSAVEALIDLTEGRERMPSDLVASDLDEVRAIAGARYLRAHHEHWKAGSPTPTFWRDRTMEGGATGLAIPLGDLEDESNPFAARVAAAAARAAGPDQPRPQGLLVLSKGGHYGNRPGEFSLDLIPSDLESALAVNESLGQQHTLPGSVGETSGTVLDDSRLALVWEIQPNIFKPSKDRNQSANKAFRRHRNWHLVTSIAAFAWLEENGLSAHVLAASALALAHEVNPDKPVTPEIEAFHSRTVTRALSGLGLATAPHVDGPDREDLWKLVDQVFSHHVEDKTLGQLIERVVPA